MNPQSNIEYIAIEEAGVCLAQAKHLIVDLDGTLIREDEAVEGAVELLARYRDRYVIVSNNSTHTADGVVRRLGRLGLHVVPERIVLAGEQTVDFMRHQHPEARLLFAGSRALQRYAVGSGCLLVKSEADFVVLGLDPGFNYARLCVIVDQLRCGARLVVTNCDVSHPGAEGRLVPETGAVLAAVMAASGVQPVHVTGKPETPLLQEGLRRLGATPDNTVVIGDNPATDAKGAGNLGMRCLLVDNSGQAGAASLSALLRAADAARAGELTAVQSAKRISALLRP
ncbi:MULTISPECIES: HAD-IIA family hydrolase [Paraburkholderia]|uniref:HAD-IIA family hydrolase n=1 Tax=Paraburkholderia TaxID=1822464 RepID=UPI00036C9366|nr:MULTISPECIES: HAD-IIA family hydrolase [Paraburkholderia]MDH6147591.1 4-nitrophenyl phosphatase [Paraburkholderia sp. WSM4179]